MIAYYYPPLLDVGAKRSYYFSKYLKEFGWSPIVLSVKNPDKFYCKLGNSSPPEGIKVFYSRSIFSLAKITGRMNGLLSRLAAAFNKKINRNIMDDLIFLPDVFWPWVPLTFFRALHLIKKYKIGTIYISCSPFSAATIGIFLKKVTDVQLVIDFRDPFALELDMIDSGIPNWRQKVNKAYEKWVVNKADLFIVNTKEVEKLYRKRYASMVKDKMVTVYNGHHFDDLPDDKRLKFKKFTIIYVGTFYLFSNEAKKYTHAFYEAMVELEKKGIISESNFQFLYIGNEANAIREYGKQYGIEKFIKTKNWLPQKTVYRLIQKSHLQLLRIVKPMISTKLFEGMLFNTPFLATFPEGEAADLVREFSTESLIITKPSKEEVYKSLKSIIIKPSFIIHKNSKLRFLNNYSRKAMAVKLKQILENSFV